MGCINIPQMIGLLLGFLHQTTRWPNLGSYAQDVEAAGSSPASPIYEARIGGVSPLRTNEKKWQFNHHP